MKHTWRNRIIGIIALIIILGLTFYAYSMRHHILQLQRYGYPGIFIIEFIANASVMIPIPGSAVTAAMAPLLNPFILAVVASTAASLGELFGYLVGIGAHTFLEDKTWIDRVEVWLKKHGGIVITLLAAIPNPFFDTAGIAAGTLEYPPLKFFLWCWLGKTINRLVVTLGLGYLIRMALPM